MTTIDLQIDVTSDPARIDRGLVHRFLAEQSSWAQGIPRETVDRAIDHSLCLSAFIGGGQVGFARVVTDRATFAYLCDVFTLPEHRGRGVARALLQAIDGHPALQGLRRFLLFTRDAGGLYARFGFAPLVHPERGMERRAADPYRRSLHSQTAS